MELMLETYIIAVHVLFPYMFYMIWPLTCWKAFDEDEIDNNLLIF